MDKPGDEMQNLGFFGIHKESIKMVLSHKNIFVRISMTFILPLSFILLVHFYIADIIESTINHDDQDRQYNNNKDLYLYRKL